MGSRWGMAAAYIVTMRLPLVEEATGRGTSALGWTRAGMQLTKRVANTVEDERCERSGRRAKLSV